MRRNVRRVDGAERARSGVSAVIAANLEVLCVLVRRRVER